MIELIDVHKSFGEQHVLRGMSFTLEQGQTLVVLGRSGTGKSVTLKHVVGLLQPDSGQVIVNGVDVASADAEGLREIRRQVAYLFQTGALVNWLSVRDNVALPLVERRDMPSEEIRERVDESLGSLDMLQHADKMPANISGGMRKRAALARVLVQEPDAILYDEPTAGLDPIMGRTVGRLIQEVQSSGERAAIVVTHDMDLAFQVGTEIALHYEGQLVERAPPEVFEQSSHPVIREFLRTRERPGKASP
ncbi:MAG: ATP-binding cassette domain-containing protein [Planctomycetes bacterium]|nr:ATP-binding cassette domain-containing protein [Planctomycetota bacterium]